jgi:hypothetical protein
MTRSTRSRNVTPSDEAPEVTETAPETESETAPETESETGEETAPNGGVDFEDAAWPTKAAEEPNPAMVAKLRESWDQGVERNGRRECRPFAVTCKDEPAVNLRTRQLRQAATSLGIGVAIKRFDLEGGAGVRLVFRARKRRNSPTTS